MTMAEVEVGEQGAPGADQSSEQADQSAKPAAWLGRMRGTAGLNVASVV